MLREEIPLGTKFAVYSESLRGGLSFQCGHCGNWVRDVLAISVYPLDNPKAMPELLPLLFFIPESVVKIQGVEERMYY